MKADRFVAGCISAAILIVIVYANSLQNAFHFDDSHVIENNVYLRSLENIPLFFTDAHTFSSRPQNATYRPLVTLSLALDYAWGDGLDPRAFHITQIVLLLITGALLVAFFITLTGSPMASLFCATLFCLHTANTETMNLISARSELLSTVALLASFLLFIHSPFARRTLLYLVPLVIGALAKAPVVVFAPLLFFYVMFYEKQSARRAFKTSLPPLVLGIALLIFLNAMNAPEWTSGSSARWPYLITQPFVWLHYVRLFFLPIGLTADTDLQPFAHWYDTRAVAGYVFVALLIYAIVRARKREEMRPVAFGLAWFAIALMPTSSVFPLAEVMNEHRIYFAYIGLAVAVVWWIVLNSRRVPRGVMVAGAIIVLAAHAVGAHERNKAWRTQETLWSDVIAKSPGNGRGWMNYGLTHMAKGRYEVALRSFERAHAITPNYSTLEINLGIVKGEMGRHEEAERHFRRAITLTPDERAHFYYARWLVPRGRAAEARLHLRDAVRINPAFVQARGLLLRIYAAAGSTELSALAEGMRRLNPKDADLAHATQRWPAYDAALQAGLEAMGRKEWLTAAQASRDAVRHSPRSADAFNNLGWALSQAGLREEAIAAYRQAVAIDPKHTRAVNNLRALLPQ